VGDVITQIEGYSINNEQTLIGVFQEFRADQTISLTVLRDDATIQTKMKLEK
jgi:S1-C subfamily serine protease